MVSNRDMVRRKVKSPYKHVSSYLYKGDTIKYVANIRFLKQHKTFNNEIEAAIFVDTKLIEAGMNPVNRLKKV